MGFPRWVSFLGIIFGKKLDGISSLAHPSDRLKVEGPGGLSSSPIPRRSRPLFKQTPGQYQLTIQRSTKKILHCSQYQSVLAIKDKCQKTRVIVSSISCLSAQRATPARSRQYTSPSTSQRTLNGRSRGDQALNSTHSPRSLRRSGMIDCSQVRYNHAIMGNYSLQLPRN